MSALADRIRDVLRTPPRRDAERSAATPSESSGIGIESTADTGAKSVVASGCGGTNAELERVLGGTWLGDGPTRCFVVESRYDPQVAHGSETVGSVAHRVTSSIDGANLLAGFPLRAPYLFFDLETTGLGGGAGSYAFLIGFGWFDAGDAFVTRQFVVVRFFDERAVLGAVAAELSRAGALVSFNGRSFDAPVLETRFSYHRLQWMGGELAHLDMLPVARRFWKRDTAEADGAGCSLSALEPQLLGYQRRADVSGMEIPGRYFQFVRTGDPRPLAAVFEHNRRDLLSLAALTARALHLVRTGPVAASTAREVLALGWVYGRAGLGDRAADAYQHATDSTASPTIHVEAFKALALAARRARLHDRAAEYWLRVLRVPGCPAVVVREATEALAIHHEHRARDLVTARTFARRNLELGGTSRSNEAGRYRLRRIERKLQNFEVCSLKFEG